MSKVLLVEVVTFLGKEFGEGVGLNRAGGLNSATGELRR